MKNIFILIAAMAFFSSCEKDLPTYISFEAYEFASLDENGGTWDPILLDSATQIGIPPPEDVTSPSYLAELADLKAAAPA